MDFHLQQLEQKSVYILREAKAKFKNVAMLWSMGKDSVAGDGELYYRINGKVKWGTIEELYRRVTSKKIYRKGKKEIIIPVERVEVLTMKGENQKNAKIEFGRVTALISHPTDKDMYEVTLTTKRRIKVTGDHGLIAAKSGGKQGLSAKPIEVRKLTKKDSIFCPNQFNFDTPELKEWDGIIIEDWLLVLGGLWLADGCYAIDRKIIISTGKNKGIINFLTKIPREKPVTEKIAEELSLTPVFQGASLSMATARELGVKYGVSFWSAYNAKKRFNTLLNRSKNLYLRITPKGDVWLHSKALVSKLKQLEFQGKGNDKKIPNWVYQLSNRQIALFLAGYFAGDGSCYPQRGGFEISFSGMNKNLILGLRPLLLRLGIVHGLGESSTKSSGFRTKNKKLYQITIHSSLSVKRFAQKIPDIGEKLQKIKSLKIANTKKSSYQISARKVVNVDLLPRKKRRVYDLEVEGTHNFVANGIVCHNSTCMLYLCKRAFFGRVPFSVINLDSGHDFPETYQFRDKVSEEWDLNLIVGKVKHEADRISGTTEGLNKTEALKKILEERKFDALIVSIRRDEHGIRAKERYFSPRDKKFRWNFENQPPEVFNYISEFKDASHVRIHPLLHWTELDVWEYTREKGFPVNPLYFAKNGKRYRSLGYKEVTKPVESNADTLDKIIEELKTTQTEERSGRAFEKEKEYVMERLRELGYM